MIVDLRYFLIFILVAIQLTSCGQNSFEKQLNGRWYSIENDGNNRLFFYPDSLIIHDIFAQKVKWLADNSKIEFDLIVFKDKYPSSNGETTSQILKYEMSNTKDSLFCQIVNSKNKQELNFIRAKNYIDYLNRKSGVHFELPHNKRHEEIKFLSEYGFKVFVGYKNNAIQVLTEYGNPLDSLESDVDQFLKKIRPKEKVREGIVAYNLHFRVFADKSITDNEFDIYQNRLAKNKIKKVFRIYATKEYNYLGALRGKEIK